MYEGYLPISKQDMQERGLNSDFLYVCGDAYVDHPVFWSCNHCQTAGGTWLYTVGIIAQPDWKR